MAEDLRNLGLIVLIALLWIIGLWLRGATYRSVYSPPRFTIWTPFIWLWETFQEWRSKRKEQDGRQHNK